MCFLQENKAVCFSDSLANSFWGGGETDWTVRNSNGASGGLAIFWKKGTLNLNYSFSGSGYVGINVCWKGSIVNLVNIYAPCSVSARRVLLERNVRFANENWCLGGDFNEILHSGERLGYGGRINRRGMEEFKEFLGHMELVDIPYVGGKYTWFKDNGRSMSRIDRFVLSKKLLDIWDVVDQRVG